MRQGRIKFNKIRYDKTSNTHYVNSNVTYSIRWEEFNTNNKKKERGQAVKKRDAKYLKHYYCEYKTYNACQRKNVIN